MKYLFIILVFAACTSAENRDQPEKDTSTIGVDSTKVGADSGILRKLP